MGALIYDGNEVEFDDRLLAHLHVVIMQKLRRGESFCLSWRERNDTGGRSSLWLHPSIPLYFRFYGSKQPVLNRDWVQTLVLSSNSPQGLVITPESESTPIPQSTSLPHAAAHSTTEASKIASARA